MLSNVMFLFLVYFHLFSGIQCPDNAQINTQGQVIITIPTTSGFTDTASFVYINLDGNNGQQGQLTYTTQGTTHIITLGTTSGISQIRAIAFGSGGPQVVCTFTVGAYYLIINLHFKS